MAKENNIEKVAKILGGTIYKNSKNEMWIEMKGNGSTISILFDSKGQNFEEIIVSKKKSLFVEEVVTRVKKK